MSPKQKTILVELPHAPWSDGGSEPVKRVRYGEPHYDECGIFHSGMLGACATCGTEPVELGNNGLICIQCSRAEARALDAIANAPDEMARRKALADHVGQPDALCIIRETEQIAARSCATCRHFSFLLADGPFSEHTPGTSFAMYCARDHWEFSAYDFTAADLHRVMTAAPTCPDYEESKENTP